MFEQGWATRDPEAMGLPGTLLDAPVNTLLSTMSYATAGLSYLEWTRYRAAAELHTRLVVPHEMSDHRRMDATTHCAARISAVLSVSQGAGEGILTRAVALRDRLPRVAECLRDGLIAPKHIHTIISRTDLVDGTTYAREVDTEIAAALQRRGSWSDTRMRDMIDRIVYRHDPDAVRERRVLAENNRSFWIDAGPDGMAYLGVTMTAENAVVVAAAVEELAGRVCRKDPRSKGARSSDALFALATRTSYECQCDDPDCSAPGWTGEDGLLTSVIVHVVTDSTTIGDSTTTAGNTAADGNPGFLVGHGVISPDHVADLADRDDALVRPVSTTNPASQPADPYRPSSALDTFVRIRDQYCTWPGCNRGVWTGDLDHIAEYDHEDPDGGGQTTDVNLGGKCRFHHNLKTFGDFVDDQYTENDTGRVVSTVTTPEGLVVPGPAHNGYDIHPGLADVTFDTPDPPPPSPPRTPPSRRRTRLADKHARRRNERNRNRRARELADTDDPPPF
ncbi:MULTISPECIES: DUF222 domain-containing protein [Nocardiaceae]|uniref:DUF222 domain-containing protein n=1 Tax=Rhodococcoides corynebacterioides TaxID=53972 RepID=A0ABS2KW96_9NOCA|nr:MULTISPECIES: DUF222 domain-containing protein [Rhodococcus]MBM7416220.1 hypothetical protein [Rhodococcus corynebacterioides]MBP1114473.1 hypothetical protein [Rhodococcus sp. PvP016]